MSDGRKFERGVPSDIDTRGRLKRQQEASGIERGAFVKFRDGGFEGVVFEVKKIENFKCTLVFHSIPAILNRVYRANERTYRKGKILKGKPSFQELKRLSPEELEDLPPQFELDLPEVPLKPDQGGSKNRLRVVK